MMKLTGLDVPPLDAGFTTVICARPTAAISAGGIVAVSWVLLPVVVRLTPFQLMAEEDTKPVPFTVRVKPVPPAAAFCGVMEEILGAELPPPEPEPPEPPELPEPPEEQFANEIRTAAATAIKHRREILIEACTERFPA
jgi:hypothetical protein